MNSYTNKDRAMDALAGVALGASIILLYCAASILDLALATQ